MTTRKKIIISIVTILACICLALDIWFIYVSAFAPEKLIDKTYELGDITTTDGTTKDLIEVKIHTNENKNGYEMLEVKFNSFMDEEKNEIYSQGLQFVANSDASSIDWDYQVSDLDRRKAMIVEKVGSWPQLRYWGIYGSYAVGDGSSYYNYASTNDFETSHISNSSPIVKDSQFLINIGEDLYKYKFKGTDNVDVTSTGEEKLQAYEYNLLYEEEVGREFLGITVINFNRYYFYQDPISFAKLMYDKFKGTAPGSKFVEVSLFEDMFDYYKYNGSSYVKVTGADEIVKVKEQFKTYLAIKVEIVADGARYASDSMFGRVHGSETFNLTGENVTNDYYLGRTIVNCDVLDFDFVLLRDGIYQLKLNDGFVKQYLPYGKTISLSIEIDLDVLEKDDVEFYGFVENSDIHKFLIYECYTLETVDGKVVRTEVEV